MEYSLEELIQLKLKETNPVIASLIAAEDKRQRETIELIASENFPSEAVRLAAASSFVAKYSEGYPTYRETGNKGRYYGGCENVDTLEQYCCCMWQSVFKTDYHVNVQPHSGSQANFAAYMAVLKPGDTILSMSLDNGGHLTHGSPVNFSGKLYVVVHYGVTNDGYINLDDLFWGIVRSHPRLVLAGASAYSRTIDFKEIHRVIGEAVEYVRNHFDPEYRRPWFMVDMAHIAGLVAAELHPSPFGLADIITTTTHKTLRGTRGGLIFCIPELAKKVDSAIFPGSQGGPLQHIIAAKAVTAEEAITLDFKRYIAKVIENAAAMSDEFTKLGYHVVTGGTDNHLFLIDFSVTHPNLTGKMVQDELDRHGITLNKNCVPGEKRSPVQTSGVRIGTAAMTTKGYTAEDFRSVARRIDEIIRQMNEVGSVAK